MGKVARWVLQRGMYFAYGRFNLGRMGGSGEKTYGPDAQDDTLVPGFVWVGGDLVDCFGDEANYVVGVVVKLGGLLVDIRLVFGLM